MRRPKVAVLTMRRSGASGIQRLLADVCPADCDFGSDPFLWSRPLGPVSQEFHAGNLEACQKLLSQALTKEICFKHSFDLEPIGFNRMLVGELCRQGYRLVYFEREDESARLFSLHVACKYDAWTRQEIVALRHRMRNGGLREDSTNQGALARMIREQCVHTAALQEMMSACTAPVLKLKFETFFRDGIGVLAQANELFGFAGLGARDALLSDDTLMQIARGGEQYTEALCAVDAGLRTARTFIASELARVQKLACQTKEQH